MTPANVTTTASVIQAVSNRWVLVRPLLAEAWPAVFTFFLVLAGSIAIGYLFPSDPAGTRPIRIAAFILEIEGVLAVAFGIAERERHFKREGWFKRVWNALRGPRHITLVSDGLSVGLSGVAAIAVAGSLNAAGDVEARLAVVERDIALIRRDHAEHVKTVNNSFAAVERRIAGEARVRESSLRDLTRQIEDLTVGGVQIEKIGLVWLAMGVLFGNLTDEVALVMRSLAKPFANFFA